MALGLSALTYVAAALSLSGFVPGRLNFIRTMLAQLAGSFVTLVTPAAVGGAALNVRYLQRNKVPPAVAAASVGVVQVVAFVLHICCWSSSWPSPVRGAIRCAPLPGPTS